MKKNKKSLSERMHEDVLNTVTSIFNFYSDHGKSKTVYSEALETVKTVAHYTQDNLSEASVTALDTVRDALYKDFKKSAKNWMLESNSCIEIISHTRNNTNDNDNIIPDALNKTAKNCLKIANDMYK